jgi:hypothetical protein
LIKYPDQIKNLIHQSIYENSTKNKFQEYLEMEGVELIKATIKQIRPDKDDVTLQILVTQLLSCLLFPVLLGDRATEIFGIKLNDPKKRNAYIELLIKNVIQ